MNDGRESVKNTDFDFFALKTEGVGHAVAVDFNIGDGRVDKFHVNFLVAGLERQDAAHPLKRANLNLRDYILELVEWNLFARFVADITHGCRHTFNQLTGDADNDLRG